MSNSRCMRAERAILSAAGKGEVERKSAVGVSTERHVGDSTTSVSRWGSAACSKVQPLTQIFRAFLLGKHSNIFLL